MATWIAHLMIADKILEKCPDLDRRGYCVGNIAPDCNIENEDWSAFTPPREVTHWMGGSRKAPADCDRFLEEYLYPRMRRAASSEERSFLLGYYSHLIADAQFQLCIRDEARVRNAWARIRADRELCGRAEGMPKTWDSIKALIPKRERMQEIEWIDAEYLRTHPDSGYLTEILPLREFPDYIDYLPSGCIVRKIGVMGSIPSCCGAAPRFIAISREEYASYIQTAARLILNALKSPNLIP